MESPTMWLFVSGFFHLASCFLGSSVLHHGSELHYYNSWIIFHCTEIAHLFIHSSGGGHLGCFQRLSFLKLWSDQVPCSLLTIFLPPKAEPQKQPGLSALPQPTGLLVASSTCRHTPASEPPRPLHPLPATLFLQTATQLTCHFTEVSPQTSSYWRDFL